MQTELFMVYGMCHSVGITVEYLQFLQAVVISCSLVKYFSSQCTRSCLLQAPLCISEASRLLASHTSSKRSHHGSAALAQDRAQDATSEGAASAGRPEERAGHGGRQEGVVAQGGATGSPHAARVARTVGRLASGESTFASSAVEGSLQSCMLAVDARSW